MRRALGFVAVLDVIAADRPFADADNECDLGDVG